MTDLMQDLAKKAIDAALLYWNEYQKQQGRAPVVWVRNNETNYLLVFTRGEYTQRLLETLPTEFDTDAASFIGEIEEIIMTLEGFISSAGYTQLIATGHSSMVDTADADTSDVFEEAEEKCRNTI